MVRQYREVDQSRYLVPPWFISLALARTNSFRALTSIHVAYACHFLIKPSFLSSLISSYLKTSSEQHLSSWPFLLFLQEEIRSLKQRYKKGSLENEKVNKIKTYLTSIFSSQAFQKETRISLKLAFTPIQTNGYTILITVR